MFIYQTAQYLIPEDHNLNTHRQEISDLKLIKLQHKEIPARTAMSFFFVCIEGRREEQKKVQNLTCM
jgi:hypothetical protein